MKNLLFLSSRILKANFHSVLLSLCILCLASCSATQYGPTVRSGGYSTLPMGDNIYRVYFGSNAHTSKEVSARFLLRRCAELTLEQGKRYFILNSQQSDHTVGRGPMNTISTWPSGTAIITIVDKLEEGKATIDALMVIEQTNGVAKGRLSTKARVNYKKRKDEWNEQAGEELSNKNQ